MQVTGFEKLDLSGRWCTLMTMAAALAHAPCSVQAQRLTPALDLSSAAGQAQMLRDDLAKLPGGLEDAERRLAALAERGDRAFVAKDVEPGEAGQVGGGGGGAGGSGGGGGGGGGQVLLSMQALLALLPQDAVRELGKSRDGLVGRELEALRSRADADAGEFVELAMRNPASGVRSQAITEASRRLNRRGDPWGASDVMQLAGFSMRPGAVTSVTGLSIAGCLNSYWWFDKQPDRLGGARVYPVRAGESVFVSSATHCMSFRLPAPGSDGTVKLQWVHPPVSAASNRRGPRVSSLPDESSQEPFRAGRMDFPSFEPSVMCDVEGTPRCVVARHIGPEGDAFLRAYRASDGAVLWSTSADPNAGQFDARLGDEKRYAYCSSPTAVGRYVYVLATDGVRGGSAKAAAPRGASLVLVALESTTGRLMFATPIGGLSQVPPVRRRRGNDPRDITRTPGLWDEQTPLRVAGAFVYVVAGGGVFQVERFTGVPIRAASYPTCAEVAREGSDPASQPASRWTDTPLLAGEADQTLVCAPRDTEEVIAFDRATMRVLWRLPRLGGYTPFAAYVLGKDSFVALQGRDSVLVVSSRDGQTLWRADLRGGARFTGPALLVPAEAGATPVIAAPTDRGTALLLATTGQWLPSDTRVRVPEVNMWASGDLVATLRETSVLAAWSVTGADEDSAPELPVRPPPVAPSRPGLRNLPKP